MRYKNKYELYKIDVFYNLQKMKKFTDNTNYDASTSVISVVIAPYIVYVYMYPICQMLVCELILLLILYLKGAKIKVG